MKLNVYLYQSVENFFIDSYTLFKEVEGFSLRKWATEMGFNSPAVLNDLIKGKKGIKLKYIEHFAKGLGLSQKEMVYLKTLYFFQRATGEEKEYYLSVMDSLRPIDVEIEANSGVFSHWLNVIIYTLGQMRSEGMTFMDIKKSLKEDVPASLIMDSLNLLKENNLISFDGNHYKLNQEGNITTQNDVLIKSSHRYYQQVISKATHAVELNVNERELQCFAVGMKKEDLGKVKEIIREARKNISALQSREGDSIYQFALNGYPVAEV